MGHAGPAFGPPARRSGLRVGDRPVHAGPFGACRGSEDAPAACRGTVILFGGEPSGTGSRGCPAVLDFRREGAGRTSTRSEEHTSELQSLMRISYAVFCL